MSDLASLAIGVALAVALVLVAVVVVAGGAAHRMDNDRNQK